MLQPSLRFPFFGIRSPDALVAIRSEDRNDHVGVLGYGYLVDVSSVDTFDRPHKGHHDVFPSSEETMK